ncbi:phosphatase PAP2 family protein [Cellulophaga baltica]|uniref:Membrane-associated phospholipid phosphatase n=1 Tax=Cellulophaga baltica TaxID=76594 RepID=A0A1G7CXI3_9FLAO|nr:phosphatase PAP2 family protein [Cellulophaga baltica]MBA6313313.1 phosphatase PAP2 family protein [Cellulophaga baltica]SDE43376.1 Membrane-associated phospholipid phosphatase [Cellulophaga baltica]
MQNHKITQKVKILPIVIFFLIGLRHLQGQQSLETQPFSDSTETTWQSFKYDLGSVFGGVGYSYTRPLHWQGKQWATLGAITAGTGILYIFDEETSNFSIRQKEGIPEFIRDYGSEFGSPQYNYMFTGGVYLTGLVTKNEKLRRTGVLLIASATSAGLLQQLTKSLVGRARPVSGKTKDTFDPFNPSRNFHSFPSGHTMLAFTNAYAIAKQFKNPWTKAGIYTVGLIPGVSRMWDGQHWLTDVALGVAISIFTVESIDRYLDGRYDEKYNDQSKKVSWNLDLGPGKIGIVGRF